MSATETAIIAKPKLATASAETRGRRPLRVDIRPAQALDAEAQDHHSGQTLIDGLLPRALLADQSRSDA